MCTNYNGTAYTPTSPKVHNFNVYDGLTYQAADPLLGCDGPGAFGLGSGNYWSRVGQKLITAGYCQRVRLIPVGIGTTLISDWAYGGRHAHRISVAIAWMQSLGIPIDGIICDIGNSDRNSGVGTSAWAASFAQVQANIRSAGCNANIFVALESKFGVGATTSAAVRAAQAAVVSGTVFQGADMDSIVDAQRQDGTHLNATGADTAAGLWATILAAH